VSSKAKSGEEQEAAGQIAEMMYAALLKLPKEDQKATVRAIQKIKIVKNRKTSKRSSIPVSFRQSSKAATARRKRVHP
jgi:hypothetical protein